MPDTHHTGSCHCGAVKYEVDLDLSQPAIQCNCSMCARTGTLLSFAPASSFKLVQGDDNLTDYQFNKQVIHHLFCKTCGVKSFARGETPDGKPTVAVNVRCLDDFDLAQTKTMDFDGRSK